MNTQSTVGSLVVERPSRARVFEQFGIDYCCGGKIALDLACKEKGIDIVQVVHALGVSDGGDAKSERNWAEAPLTDLADHIEKSHHGYMKTELPRLDFLISKVVRAHGPRHPELSQVQDVFTQFSAELTQHMQKEERVLFPLCRALDSDGGAVESPCGSVANPIAVMIAEHDDAGAALARMRELTGGYAAPQGACNTYRAMLSSLAELEADMHQHVHKENNILFPRAIRREQTLSHA